MRARRKEVCVGPGTLFAAETVTNANSLSISHRSLLFAWLGLVLFPVMSAWAKEPAKPASEYFAIQLGEKVVRMQLAVLPQEMARGLMFRKSLKPDEGMLFVYGKPNRQKDN